MTAVRYAIKAMIKAMMGLLARLWPCGNQWAVLLLPRYTPAGSNRAKLFTAPKEDTVPLVPRRAFYGVLTKKKLRYRTVARVP